MLGIEILTDKMVQVDIIQNKVQNLGHFNKEK